MLGSVSSLSTLRYNVSRTKCERGGEERCKAGLQWTLHQSAHWSDGCHPPRFWVKSFHTFLSVSALVSLKLFSLIWSSFSSKTLVVFVTMLHHNTNTDSLLCHDSRLGTWVGWLWGQHAYLTWSITMALGHTNTHWHKRTSKSPAYALDCVYLQYGCTGQWLRPSKWNCLHWFKTC